MSNKEKITSADYEKEKQDNKSIVNQDKETKKKSNAQKAIPPLIVAVVSLVIILTCFLIAYYQILFVVFHLKHLQLVQFSILISQ